MNNERKRTMNMIELHMIQSFPVTCLNRDDVGAPKSAVFGGVQRARVSSQSWKRAIREMAKEINRAAFCGSRTRKAAVELTDILRDAFKWSESDARKTAEEVLHLFLSKELPKAKKNKKTEADNETESKEDTSTLLYFSPTEIRAIADGIHQARSVSPNADSKKLKDAAVKSLGRRLPMDAADIAVFGRMVSNATDITLEGAGLFSHSLSTHQSTNELDFWTAVDDEKTIGDDAGAANMGTAEFNAACYYRYVGVNLDLLKQNLSDAVSEEERMAILDAFVRATVLAVPTARKNSMFGFTPPAYVLGVRRTGQPISLVNAFERPVRAGSEGFLSPSVEALKAHWGELQARYCLTPEIAVELPPANLDDFIRALLGGLA